MTEEEYTEIRGSAERHRMTVSEWVRLRLRMARDREAGGAALAAREHGPSYGGGPPPLGTRARIEMDVREELLEAVRERYRLPSWQAAVEFALGRVAVTPMSKKEALEMEGAGWEGDLDALRSADSTEVW